MFPRYRNFIRSIFRFFFIILTNKFQRLGHLTPLSVPLPNVLTFSKIHVMHAILNFVSLFWIVPLGGILLTTWSRMDYPLKQQVFLTSYGLNTTLTVNLQALNTLTSSHDDLHQYAIPHNNWATLETIADFLEPFKDLTVKMSASSVSTAFSIIPLFNIIIDHIEDAIPKEAETEAEAEANSKYSRVVLRLRI